MLDFRSVETSVQNHEAPRRHVHRSSASGCRVTLQSIITTSHQIYKQAMERPNTAPAGHATNKGQAALYLRQVIARPSPHLSHPPQRSAVGRGNDR